MSASPQRVELAQGFLLHQRPWRDTSRILEVFTREHGRLSLFARGVRSPAARLSGVLQPFQPLLLSWGGRGETPYLRVAERDGHVTPLPAAVLLSGFYLNELLLKLTVRHDPQPQLFEDYQATLASLRGAAAPAVHLRLFEKRLLELLGYGLELQVEARSGEPVNAAGWYRFRATDGLARVAADGPGRLAGASLLALAGESLEDTRALEDARLLLRAALDACLEGRALNTRAVARAMREQA